MATTRLSPAGLPGAPWGDFSGKTESIPEVPALAASARNVTERPIFPHSRPETFQAVMSWSAALIRQLTALYQEYGYRVNRTLLVDGTEPMQQPLPLAGFTEATLPPAADWPGSLIIVSDGAPGDRLRYSDGTAWITVA